MNSLHAAWLIAKKDLKLSFRDRTGMALAFGLPVVLVLAFGSVFEMTMGRPGGAARTTLWVTDADQSPESTKLVKALRATPMLNVRPEVDAERLDAATLERMVIDGEAHHALVIAEGFGRALRAGELPPLKLLRDPGRQLDSQLVSIGLMQAVMQTGGHELMPALTTEAMVKLGLPRENAERARSLSKGFATTLGLLFMESGMAIPTNPSTSATGDAASESNAAIDLGSVFQDLIPVEKIDLAPPERPKQLSYIHVHNLGGNAQMMLMFGLVACASLLLQERDGGTLRRLLLAPVSRNALLLGKLFFTAIMGAMQLVLLFAVGSVVFDVDVLRDPFTLAVFSLVLLFAITAFGTLVATLARSQKQAEGLSTLVILLMSALGGAWFPLDQFDLPLAGQIVMKCTITHWAMHGFQGVLYHGRNLLDPLLLRDIAVLGGFGIVALAIANRLFRARFAT